jgi:hypothetical protein
VGAIGTFIAGLFMQRERWCREDEVSSRTHAIEVKRAARLIELELAGAEAAATICVEQKIWWSSDMQLTTESWQSHRAIIAPELSFTNWHAVSRAFLSVEALGKIRGNQNGDISESTAEKIVPSLRSIEAGRQCLVPLTRDAPPTSGNAAHP